MNEQEAAEQIKAKLSDRTWRLNNLYYIKDKAGKRVQFKMNWAQRQLYTNIWYFNVILKARQLGFTTFSLIYFLDACLFNSNHAAGVIADSLENASDLFTNKVKFAWDNLPEWLRKERAAVSDSAKKLVFSNGSSFTVGTSLRSGTYQKLLISEYGKVSAKFPEKAREIKTGALNTVAVGQQIFVESTAEGKAGEFYDLVQNARQLKAEARQLTRLDPRFHFFGWQDNPDYRLNDTETQLTVVPQETAMYLDKIGVRDLNQRAWYAAKSKTMGEDMRREYPSTPDEAFEGSNEGAWYTKEMALVRQSGGIKRVLYDRKHQVCTWWDIGQSRDMMSIWFSQYIGEEHRFINYHESNNNGWEFYAKFLASLDYNYAKHYWPHDGNKRIVGQTIQTSRQLAEQAGIKPIHVTPVTRDVYEDIRNYVRPIIPNCVFDEVNCARGITHLDNYRKRWDQINSMWLNDPQHDEASHGADAFRTFAMNADKLKNDNGLATVADPLQYLRR